MIKKLFCVAIDCITTALRPISVQNREGIHFCTVGTEMDNSEYNHISVLVHRHISHFSSSVMHCFTSEARISAAFLYTIIGLIGSTLTDIGHMSFI